MINGYRYTLRALFKEYPFFFVYSLYAFSTVLFGYLFRTIEFEVNDGSLDVKSFTTTNAMWCGFNTMTTAGYGDFFPKTTVGRLVGYLAAFVGVALESLAI